MPSLAPNKVSKTTGVLLLLFAISVIISQSLMDLFSTVLCLYLAYQWFQYRQQTPRLVVTPKMGFDWLWGVWLAVAAIGFALNVPPPIETPSHFWLVRLVEFKWILILYFMVGSLQIGSFKESGLKWFNAAILICSIYALIDYFIQSYNNPNIEIRLGGLFQFAMTYAHSYGIFLCVLFGIFLSTKKSLSKKQFLFSATTFLIVGASVLFTFTRGAWIAAAIAIVVISFLKSIRTGITAIITLLVLGAGLYLMVPSIKNRIDFTAKVAEAKTAKESYDTERVVLWKTNLMIFQDHPWFGTGYGQNKFKLREYYEKQGLPKDQFIGHAHNQYLHLLAGTGILGLACYLGVLGTVFLMTLFAYYKTPESNTLYKGLALGSLGGQIFFAVGGLTESNFEHSKVRFAIMLAWAFGIWLYRASKPNSQKS